MPLILDDDAPGTTAPPSNGVHPDIVVLNSTCVAMLKPGDGVEADDINRFDRAILSLYDAPLLECGWEKAIQDVAAAVGGRGHGCLQIIDHAARRHECFAFTGYTSEAYEEPHLNLWLENDIWSQSLRPGEAMPAVAIGSELVPQEVFLRSTLKNEVTDVLDCDIFDVAGAIIDIGGSEGMLAVYAGKDRPTFTAADKAMMARLYPHIQRAALTNAMLGELRDKVSISARLLDQLPYGLFMINENGRVVSENAPAHLLVESGSVLCLRDGQLHCCDARENGVFQFALNRALGRRQNHSDSGIETFSGASFKFYGRDELRPWSIMVTPLSRDETFDVLSTGQYTPRVIVTVSNHQPMTDLCAAQIAKTFGLTGQEQVLAARLSAGDTLSSIADETGRSVGTLRTHLKSVFQKTECRTQAQLVQMVLSAPLGV